MRGCFSTTPPGRGYVEIATLDIERGFMGDNTLEDSAELKKSIQPDVCAAGGHAVIAYANGRGHYVKASVLRETEDFAAQPAPARVAPAAPAAGQPGCQYDTQCKGERVCVSGQCVDPAPNAAAPSAPDTAPTAPAATPQ
jgi:hypothetical protein